MNNNRLGIRGRRIASVLSRIGLVGLRNEQGCHNFRFPFVDNYRSTPAPIIGNDLKRLKKQWLKDKKIIKKFVIKTVKKFVKSSKKSSKKLSITIVPPCDNHRQ